MITCFEPKPLVPLEGGGIALRASMFGATFLAPVRGVDASATMKLGLNKLPRSSNCQTLWEAHQLELALVLFLSHQLITCHSIELSVDT